MEQYIVEVTKRPEGAKGKQVEAVATTFNIPAHKAEQLLHRLPGVVTKPVPARLANEIAERFRKAGMEAFVHAHAAETALTGVAKVAPPKVKLPEPNAFVTAVDKMFTSDADPSTGAPTPVQPAFDRGNLEQPDFAPDFAPDFDTPDVSDSDFDGSDFRNTSDFPNPEAQAEPSQPSVVINPVGDKATDFLTDDEAAADQDEGPVLSEVSARDAAKERHPETVAKVTARPAQELHDLSTEEEAIDLEALESPAKKRPSKLLLPLFLLLVAAMLIAWFFFL